MKLIICHDVRLGWRDGRVKLFSLFPLFRYVPYSGSTTTCIVEEHKKPQCHDVLRYIMRQNKQYLNAKFCTKPT